MPTYYAGTSGRLSVSVVTPVLTTDSVDFTSALSALATGISSTAVIAEITKWSLSNPFAGEAPRSLTLESTADSEGVVYGEVLRGGVGSYTVAIEGQFNSSNAAMFRNGVMAAAAFLVKKNVAAGYKTCVGRLNNFQITGVSSQGGTVMFSATFEGSGLLPAFS